MIKKTSRSYFILFFALLGIMSIPKSSTERLQGTTVALASPIWTKLLAVKTFFKVSNDSPPASSEELQKLQIENALLREEIVNLKNIMKHEFDLLAQMEGVLQNTGLPTKGIKKRHRSDLLKLLQIQLQAVPARVIFRSPSTWNSSLWINVGSETNATLGTDTIVKNSPVLLGTAVIGVVDFVGKRQSRVRLITDTNLTPSVRAARGEAKNLLKKEKLRDVIKILYAEGEAFDDPKQQEELIEKLEKASQNLFQDAKTSSLLAKGEIHGSSKPLWRTQRHELTGSGFNYDFADGFGLAHDLRTGKTSDDSKIEAIVQAGDVLVTTGLDGVFPPGLPVAEVTHVHPLKEGDYYYELEAMPVAGNLDDLTLVFVIPPLGYNPDDTPNSYSWP